MFVCLYQTSGVFLFVFKTDGEIMFLDNFDLKEYIEIRTNISIYPSIFKDKWQTTF